MSKMKKAVIALSVTSVVIFVAVVSIVIVWAASSQSVSNQLTISYTATNVNVWVKASYRSFSDNKYTDFGDPITFTPTEQQQIKQYPSQNIKLIDDKTGEVGVYIRYRFVDLGVGFQASLDESGITTTNMTVTCTFAYADIDVGQEGNYTFTSASQAPLIGIPMGGSSPVDGCAIVKIQVTDLTKPASYSGTINWTLTGV